MKRRHLLIKLALILSVVVLATLVLFACQPYEEEWKDPYPIIDNEENEANKDHTTKDQAVDRVTDSIDNLLEHLEYDDYDLEAIFNEHRNEDGTYDVDGIRDAMPDSGGYYIGANITINTEDGSAFILKLKANMHTLPYDQFEEGTTEYQIAEQLHNERIKYNDMIIEWYEGMTNVMLIGFYFDGLNNNAADPGNNLYLNLQGSKRIFADFGDSVLYQQIVRLITQFNLDALLGGDSSEDGSVTSQLNELLKLVIDNNYKQVLNDEIASIFFSNVDLGSITGDITEYMQGFFGPFEDKVDPLTNKYLGFKFSTLGTASILTLNSDMQFLMTENETIGKEILTGVVVDLDGVSQVQDETELGITTKNVPFISTIAVDYSVRTSNEVVIDKTDYTLYEYGNYEYIGDLYIPYLGLEMDALLRTDINEIDEDKGLDNTTNRVYFEGYDKANDGLLLGAYYSDERTYIDIEGLQMLYGGIKFEDLNLPKAYKDGFNLGELLTWVFDVVDQYIVYSVDYLLSPADDEEEDSEYSAMTEAIMGKMESTMIDEDDPTSRNTMSLRIDIELIRVILREMSEDKTEYTNEMIQETIEEMLGWPGLLDDIAALMGYSVDTLMETTWFLIIYDVDSYAITIEMHSDEAKRSLNLTDITMGTSLVDEAIALQNIGALDQSIVDSLTTLGGNYRASYFDNKTKAYYITYSGVIERKKSNWIKEMAKYGYNLQIDYSGDEDIYHAYNAEQGVILELIALESYALNVLAVKSATEDGAIVEGSTMVFRLVLEPTHIGETVKIVFPDFKNFKELKQVMTYSAEMEGQFIFASTETVDLSGLLGSFMGDLSGLNTPYIRPENADIYFELKYDQYIREQLLVNGRWTRPGRSAFDLYFYALEGDVRTDIFRIYANDVAFSSEVPIEELGYVWLDFICVPNLPKFKVREDLFIKTFYRYMDEEVNYDDAIGDIIGGGEEGDEDEEATEVFGITTILKALLEDSWLVFEPDVIRITTSNDNIKQFFKADELIGNVAAQIGFVQRVTDIDQLESQYAMYTVGTFENISGYSPYTIKLHETIPVYFDFGNRIETRDLLFRYDPESIEVVNGEGYYSPQIFELFMGVQRGYHVTITGGTIGKAKINSLVEKEYTWEPLGERPTTARAQAGDSGLVQVYDAKYYLFGRYDKTSTYFVVQNPYGYEILYDFFNDCYIVGLGSNFKLNDAVEYLGTNVKIYAKEYVNDHSLSLRYDIGTLSKGHYVVENEHHYRILYYYDCDCLNPLVNCDCETRSEYFVVENEAARAYINYLYDDAVTIYTAEEFESRGYNFDAADWNPYDSKWDAVDYTPYDWSDVTLNGGIFLAKVVIGEGMMATYSEIVSVKILNREIDTDRYVFVNTEDRGVVKAPVVDDLRVDPYAYLLYKASYLKNGLATDESFSGVFFYAEDVTLRFTKIFGNELQDTPDETGNFYWNFDFDDANKTYTELDISNRVPEGSTAVTYLHTDFHGQIVAVAVAVEARTIDTIRFDGEEENGVYTVDALLPETYVLPQNPTLIFKETYLAEDGTLQPYTLRFDDFSPEVSTVLRDVKLPEISEDIGSDDPAALENPINWTNPVADNVKLVDNDRPFLQNDTNVTASFVNLHYYIDPFCTWYEEDWFFRNEITVTVEIPDKKVRVWDEDKGADGYYEGITDVLIDDLATGYQGVFYVNPLDRETWYLPTELTVKFYDGTGASVARTFDNLVWTSDEDVISIRNGRQYLYAVSSTVPSFDVKTEVRLQQGDGSDPYNYAMLPIVLRVRNAQKGDTLGVGKINAPFASFAPNGHLYLDFLNPATWELPQELTVRFDNNEGNYYNASYPVDWLAANADYVYKEGDRYFLNVQKIAEEGLKYFTLDTRIGNESINYIDLRTLVYVLDRTVVRAEFAGANDAVLAGDLDLAPEADGLYRYEVDTYARFEIPSVVRALFADGSIRVYDLAWNFTEPWTPGADIVAAAEIGRDEYRDSVSLRYLVQDNGPAGTIDIGAKSFFLVYDDVTNAVRDNMLNYMEFYYGYRFEGIPFRGGVSAADPTDLIYHAYNAERKLIVEYARLGDGRFYIAYRNDYVDRQILTDKNDHLWITAETGNSAAINPDWAYNIEQYDPYYSKLDIEGQYAGSYFNRYNNTYHVRYEGLTVAKREAFIDYMYRQGYQITLREDNIFHGFNRTLGIVFEIVALDDEVTMIGFRESDTNDAVYERLNDASAMSERCAADVYYDAGSATTFAVYKDLTAQERADTLTFIETLYGFKFRASGREGIFSAFNPGNGSIAEYIVFNEGGIEYTFFALRYSEREAALIPQGVAGLDGILNYQWPDSTDPDGNVVPGIRYEGVLQVADWAKSIASAHYVACERLEDVVVDFDNKTISVTLKEGILIQNGKIDGMTPYEYFVRLFDSIYIQLENAVGPDPFGDEIFITDALRSVIDRIYAEFDTQQVVFNPGQLFTIQLGQGAGADDYTVTLTARGADRISTGTIETEAGIVTLYNEQNELNYPEGFIFNEEIAMDIVYADGTSQRFGAGTSFLWGEWSVAKPADVTEDVSTMTRPDGSPLKLYERLDRIELSVLERGGYVWLTTMLPDSSRVYYRLEVIAEEIGKGFSSSVRDESPFVIVDGLITIEDIYSFYPLNESLIAEALPSILTIVTPSGRTYDVENVRWTLDEGVDLVSVNYKGLPTTRIASAQVMGQTIEVDLFVADCTVREIGYDAAADETRNYVSDGLVVGFDAYANRGYAGAFVFDAIRMYFGAVGNRTPNHLFETINVTVYSDRALAYIAFDKVVPYDITGHLLDYIDDRGLARFRVELPDGQRVDFSFRFYDKTVKNIVVGTVSGGTYTIDPYADFVEDPFVDPATSTVINLPREITVEFNEGAPYIYAPQWAVPENFEARYDTYRRLFQDLPEEDRAFLFAGSLIADGITTQSLSLGVKVLDRVVESWQFDGSTQSDSINGVSLNPNSYYHYTDPFKGKASDLPAHLKLLQGSDFVGNPVSGLPIAWEFSDSRITPEGTVTRDSFNKLGFVVTGYIKNKDVGQPVTIRIYIDRWEYEGIRRKQGDEFQIMTEVRFYFSDITNISSSDLYQVIMRKQKINPVSNTITEAVENVDFVPEDINPGSMYDYRLIWDKAALAAAKNATQAAGRFYLGRADGTILMSFDGTAYYQYEKPDITEVDLGYGFGTNNNAVFVVNYLDLVFGDDPNQPNVSFGRARGSFRQESNIDLGEVRVLWNDNVSFSSSYMKGGVYRGYTVTLILSDGEYTYRQSFKVMLVFLDMSPLEDITIDKGDTRPNSLTSLVRTEYALDTYTPANNPYRDSYTQELVDALNLGVTRCGVNYEVLYDEQTDSYFLMGLTNLQTAIKKYGSTADIVSIAFDSEYLALYDNTSDIFYIDGVENLASAERKYGYASNLIAFVADPSYVVLYDNNRKTYYVYADLWLGQSELDAIAAKYGKATIVIMDNEDGRAIYEVEKGYAYITDKALLAAAQLKFGKTMRFVPTSELVLFYATFSNGYVLYDEAALAELNGAAATEIVAEEASYTVYKVPGTMTYYIVLRDIGQFGAEFIRRMTMLYGEDVSIRVTSDIAEGVYRVATGEAFILDDGGNSTAGLEAIFGTRLLIATDEIAELTVYTDDNGRYYLDNAQLLSNRGAAFGSNILAVFRHGDSRIVYDGVSARYYALDEDAAQYVSIYGNNMIGSVGNDSGYTVYRSYREKLYYAVVDGVWDETVAASLAGYGPDLLARLHAEEYDLFYRVGTGRFYLAMTATDPYQTEFGVYIESRMQEVLAQYGDRLYVLIDSPYDALSCPVVYDAEEDIYYIANEADLRAARSVIGNFATIIVDPSVFADFTRYYSEFDAAHRFLSDLGISFRLDRPDGLDTVLGAFGFRPLDISNAVAIAGDWDNVDWANDRLEATEPGDVIELEGGEISFIDQVPTAGTGEVKRTLRYTLDDGTQEDFVYYYSMTYKTFIFLNRDFSTIGNDSITAALQKLYEEVASGTVEYSWTDYEKEGLRYDFATGRHVDSVDMTVTYSDIVWSDQCYSSGNTDTYYSETVRINGIVYRTNIVKLIETK